MAVKRHCGYRPVIMRRILHRAVALLAAYAVALQGLLVVAVAAPYIVPAGASFALCRADDAGAPTGPVHDKCDACLAGHCAGAAGWAERVTFAAPWPVVSRAEPSRRSAARDAPIPHLRAHGPRAPPRA
jgi:hypothetical protein